MPKISTKNVKSTPQSTFSLVVLFCFFFSGLAGLIYQILWLRIIDKVIGSAPFAVATVLSVFMGGLAFGSWIAGKYVDRIGSRPDLLSLYGKVEISIGLYGILLPLLIFMAKPVHVLAYNALFMHFWAYRIFAFLGCSLFLLVPTTLMGVTLPLLCRFYVEELGHIGARTGRLYGINTIGGAAGAVLCGFFLIDIFGVWGTILTAAGINILIGIICLGMARGGRPVVSKSATRGKGKDDHRAPEYPRVIPLEDKSIAILALWIFGISGFCSMAYEVFWTRLLGLIMGPTTYSFSLVVSTFIVGLALGNIIFGRLADRAKGVFRLLVLTQACAACLALLVSQFLGNSQFLFSKLIYTFQDDFGAKILVQSAVLFFILIGPTIFLGATFPLVSRIYARSLPDIGKSIGTAYAMNTTGAILGSFVAGFILIPLLGKESGIRITAGLQLFVSLMALTYLVLRTGERIRAAATGLVTLSLGILLLINLPSWNHDTLSRGWYHRFETFEKYFSTTSWFDAMWNGQSKFARVVAGNELVFYGDGIGGFTTVEKWVNPVGIANYTLLNNGKEDASSHGDRLTQTLLAHVPLLFHPEPQKVMVLGLASGMTAGEVLLYPVKQLDVLEINDQAVKAAQLFNPWNNNCLTDPRTRIIVQDGRNHLELTREKYDVIISEPSNPWMAGMANLFTLEHFETIKGRLTGNGIFAQWIHSYEMDWPTFAMVGRTFAEVFPDGLLIKMMSSDYLLVGFSGKRNLDMVVADKNIAYALKSGNIIVRDPGVIFNLIVSEDLKGLFGIGPFHTDNMPRLEFAAPKNMGGSLGDIEARIKNNSQLTKETKEIVEANKNIDSSLDTLELMTADFSPPFNDVDLTRAAPAQNKRYRDIVRDYCSEESVTDYGIFSGIDVKTQCAQLQLDKIRKHLDYRSQDSQALYNSALALKIVGRTGEEIDALQKAISLDQDFNNAYLELGIAFETQGRFDDAIAQFSKALKIKPDSPETYANLGNVFAQQQRNEEAINYYSRALLLNPDFADAHNNLGNVLKAQGKTDEAIYHFSKALQVKPDSAGTQHNLGRLFAGQGRFDEALVQFYEILKVDKGNADVQSDVGLILLRQGKMSEAVDHLDAALEIDQNHFSARYNLGIAMLQQDKFEEAAGHFLKAIELKPDVPGVHKDMGIVMGNMRRFKEAAGYFSEALKLEPGSAETHDNLGVTFAQMGQLDEAISHFNKALEINSSFEAARDHLKIARYQKQMEKRQTFPIFSTSP
jgi:spermidine synthase